MSIIKTVFVTGIFMVIFLITKYLNGFETTVIFIGAFIVSSIIDLKYQINKKS